MLQIRDEYATPWYVDLKEDPAGPLCKLLEKAGFKDIALPRQAILTGTVPEEIDLSRLDATLVALSLVDSVNKTVRKKLVANAEHQALVYLCWRILHGKD